MIGAGSKSDAWEPEVRAYVKALAEAERKRKNEPRVQGPKDPEFNDDLYPLTPAPD